MKLWAIVDDAGVALRANAMRSLLTALGLIIGIASVVVMTAVGNGLQGLVLRQIASFDRTLTMIVPQVQGGSGQVSGPLGYLRDRDLAAIKRSVSKVRLAGAQVRRVGRISANSRSWTTQLTGADADTLEMLNLHIESGRLFSPREHASAARVAVIGETVKDRLFGAGALPDEARIRINGSPAKIIGVVRASGTGLGVDQNDIVYAPLSTARRRLAAGAANSLPSDAVHSIWLTFQSEAAAQDAKSAIAAIFDRRYALRGSDLKSYSVVSMREQLQKSRKAVAAFSIALSGIASISLFVGGIGIMNMMLVSVTERTGEIGLRMAVGASPAAVRSQFLAESLMLCLAGGVIGVGIGAAIAELLRHYMSDWPISTDASSVAVAAIVSCAIGIFFGIVPAVRASRMSPVEALKHG